ncbi:MAG: universal stress protein [Nitrospiraceae bacterium]|nr:universal stress protein [Nitrospiraceae bacterium]
MEIKRILFPTDFSEGSDHALPYAIDMARNYNAKLYIVHVIYDIARAVGWHVTHISIDDLYKDIAENAKKEMERYSNDIPKNLSSVEKIILKGTPYSEIIKFAKENTIDIIVMGTHGRRGIDRVLFGSTAERVVRDAPCPVLSVRQPAHHIKNK